MELKEAKLFQPLKAWLKDQGYSVYAEVHGIDVVADKPEHQIAFEMKMSCTHKVIEQANSARGWCDASYVVIPTKPRLSKIEQCVIMGLGIIIIHNESVNELLKPRFTKAFRRIDFTNWTEGEIAGIPVLAGSGPAQHCAKLILEYVDQNTDVTWLELYKNIPNHYANAVSMRSSMLGFQNMDLSLPMRPKKVKERSVIHNQSTLFENV